MMISKLLNKKYLIISLNIIFLPFSLVHSNEPADIWNIEKTKIIIDNNTDANQGNKENDKTNSVFRMQSEKQTKINIEEDKNLFSKKNEILGLYDPEENGLSMDMWSDSKEDQILKIYKRIDKIQLSNDAKEILNISLLTNSYPPANDNLDTNFLKIKSDWLIKNRNLELIENYLTQNKNINKNLDLLKFIADEYLSRSEVKKSCDIFLKIKENINDEYLKKFNIYCLVSLNKREEAQLKFDIEKELGFKDKFFEESFNYLMGYDNKIKLEVKEQSILDFHLSHKINPDFKFEPDNNTSEQIWRYLSTSNLLDDLNNIDLDDENKILIIEKATHNGIYTERELFNFYKRFQFNINQLLSVKESYKLLKNSEARALVYQGILITSDIGSKLDLIKILKDLFLREGIENAFKDELAKILKDINTEEVPSNYSSLFTQLVDEKKDNLTKIKINNKVIHQSKLINYFRVDMKIENTEKDLNDLLSKVKKNKKYFISTKDKILIESLKSDGIKISKKFQNLYAIDRNNMPNDIQNHIDNNELGIVLLRIVEVIGQDNLKNIGSDTLYFIVSALNQLNIDPLRNKILLKILPLKV
jgi:rRNA-processing protein FCF1